MPSTTDILALVGRDGVVVGSVAAGSTAPGDVDVVVRDNNDGRNRVMQRVIAAYPGCRSVAPGHLYVPADPLAVELFSMNCYDTADLAGMAGRTTFARARRRAILRDVLGVQMMVDTSAAAGAQRTKDGSR